MYTAESIGEIKPNSEIEEIRWLNYNNIDIISTVDKLIFNDLYEKGLFRRIKIEKVEINDENRN